MSLVNLFYDMGLPNRSACALSYNASAADTPQDLLSHLLVWPEVSCGILGAVITELLRFPAHCIEIRYP